jgi:hypothetical protein
MDSERASIIIVCVLAILAVMVIGTSGLAGNIINDAESTTNPVAGVVLLIAFILAATLVLRKLVPEGKFHR